MTALLELDGVTKRYRVRTGFASRRGELTAARGVSFRIPAGGSVAIVGETGAGKSTIAKVVLGLEQPTEGVVKFGGRLLFPSGDAALIREYRSAVTAVFQDPYASLNPRMRVGDAVAEPLRVSGEHSKGEVRSRVAAALESVGLERDAASLYPNQFSGGQRQRVVIARALINGPQLVVLDEPASALDVSVRAQILNLLRDLQDEVGTAYLLISHDLATVQFMAEYVLVMRRGEVVESGPTKKVCSAPKHPYTQALLEAVLTPRRQRERAVDHPVEQR